MPSQTFQLDPHLQRRLAARLFNRVWELLDRPDRSAEDDEEILHAAHASRYHWGQVGEAVNWARGEWQISRVYAELGRAEPALHHARRCLEIAERHDLSPFDVGCAHEAIARAARLAGSEAYAMQHAALAAAAAEEITDAEERQVLLADLATLEPG